MKQSKKKKDGGILIVHVAHEFDVLWKESNLSLQGAFRKEKVKLVICQYAGLCCSRNIILWCRQFRTPHLGSVSFCANVFCFSGPVTQKTSIFFPL